MYPVRVDLNQARGVVIRLNKYMAISIGDGDGRLIAMRDDLLHLNRRECRRILRGELNVLFWATEKRLSGVFSV